ncbi:hypothetical protein AbraIFM66951_010526 [Aspergillus brasiliensis]|uniref:3'-5' exonuclease domain-containing protein n=1 Tax=Aspergillus brasiliensis TaxID=319629 RepID=A0A9W5YUG5_9EURO|nr:hypothetical protein AbraCBS73388_010641 [Aspergillus brasiliensis]GKZ47176.1 hypothetical protein AbraIFM66951_010526 [Aspergillus brasiliensis]
MSNPTKPDIIVVDSASLLQSTIDAAITETEPQTQTQTSIPSLFINTIQRINLDQKHNPLSILTLYLLPKKTIYLIDISKLGTESVSTVVTSDGKSLKHVLESRDILKVVFDARRVSSVLFTLYGVSIDGIRDVQLMELGTRPGSKKFLAGLEGCVLKDGRIFSEAEIQAWKGVRKGVYSALRGGYVEIFDKRPMRQDVKEYCAGEVTVLVDLFKVYDAKLKPPGEAFWRNYILDTTRERVRRSRDLGFNAFDARGPWDSESIEEAIYRWNDDVMDSAMNPEETDDDRWNNHIMEEAMNPEEEDYNDYRWVDDGPTSCRDIINDRDYDDYYSD